MASEFTLATVTQATPRQRIGYRVSLGAKCLARRSTDGLIGIEIRRGDGGSPEVYPAAVAWTLFGPVVGGEEVEVKLGGIDMVGAGSYPRRYQLRVVAIGGVADLVVRDANVATSPYSEPGIVGP